MSIVVEKKELQPLEGIIGQERAVKAFNFGLEVKLKGYKLKTFAEISKMY